MDGRTDRQTDGRTDGRTEGRTTGLRELDNIPKIVGLNSLYPLPQYESLCILHSVESFRNNTPSYLKVNTELGDFEGSGYCLHSLHCNEFSVVDTGRVDRVE